MPTPPLDPRLAQQAREALNKHGGNQSQAAAALGISRSTLQRRLSHLDRHPPALDRNTAIGISMRECLETYVPSEFIPKRMREALKRLGDRAMKEPDFAREARVTVQHVREYADLAEFKRYWVVVDRQGTRLWFGMPSNAEKVRSRVTHIGA